MHSSPDSTLPARRIPTIVLINTRPELLTRIDLCVRDLEDIPKLQSVELKDAATVIAELRPFAVLVPTVLFEFDPSEFVALARDVGAMVVAYDSDEPIDALEAFLVPRLRTALAAWHRSGFSSD
jgi:hypothetical protein